MKKWLNKRTILVLVVLLALSWWWFGLRSSPNGAPLKTAPVTRGDISQTLVASGKIAADRRSTLNFPSSGKLAYLNAREGDSVSRWQVLATLDLGDLQAAQTAAYYKYLAADAAAKLVEDQVKGHDADESFAQKNSRVAAQTARDIAYDTWLSARRATRNSSLVAPFAGVVTEVTTTAIGDTVGVADGVTIVDPASLYFTSDIDETDVRYVEIGKPAKLKLDAYPDLDFSGSVYRLAFESSTSSSGATVFPVKISLPKLDVPRFRLGMNGEAELVIQEARQVLLVPIEAVIDNQVTVLRDGKEEKMQVKIGISSDTQVEISGDIKENETIVVK